MSFFFKRRLFLKFSKASFLGPKPRKVREGSGGKMGEILSPKLGKPQGFRLGCGCIGIYLLAGVKGRQREREQLGYLKGLHSRERFEAGLAGF